MSDLKHPSDMTVVDCSKCMRQSYCKTTCTQLKRQVRLVKQYEMMKKLGLIKDEQTEVKQEEN